MKTIISILIFSCFIFINNLHAELNLIGQGTSTHGTYNLIYDTDLNITWYDFTNAGDIWQNQMNWAAGLTVDFGGVIYDNWRLPNTSTFCRGFNCSSSEMGHVYYTELHNPAGTLTNTEPFQNLEANVYWSETDYYPPPSTDAWIFYFGGGDQDYGGKIYGGDHSAIAVMDGLAIVPEPISSVLFIAGGLILVGRRYMKQ